MPTVQSSPSPLTSYPSAASSVAPDGLSCQAGDGTAPRAEKKPRKGFKGFCTRVKHSRLVDSVLPESRQKRATRAARLSMGEAGRDAKPPAAPKGAGHADAGDSEIAPASAPFICEVREVPVDVPESARYEVEDQDTVSEKCAVVTGKKRKGKVRQLSAFVSNEGVSNRFADRFGRRSGKHANPVEEIEPPSVEVNGKASEKARRKARDEALKIWAVFSKAYCVAATPEKEFNLDSRVSRLHRSMRAVRKKQRGVMGTLHLSGSSAMESLVQHMHAFTKHAGMLDADRARMEVLRDGLRDFDSYDIGLMSRRLKSEEFRRKIKTAFSGKGDSDRADSGSLTREADSLLTHLDQAVADKMQSRFQLAPLHALIEAGLHVDLRGEDYNTHVPVIADAVIDLCRGYWYQLHRPGESMEAYILRLLEQEVTLAWRSPIKVALAVGSMPEDLPLKRLAGTIRCSTASRHIATCYLAVLQRLRRALEKKQPPSLPDASLEIVWRAMAATLGADDGEIQGEDLMAEVLNVVGGARRLASSMRGDNAAIPAPDDARHARARRFLDEWTARAPVAQGAGVTGRVAGEGSSVVAVDAAGPDRGLQGDDGPLACLVQTAALRSGETGRALRSYRRDTATSGAVVAASEGPDDSEALMRVLESSFPELKRTPRTADRLLVHDRGGLLRRFGKAVWQELKDQFASGRARQEAREKRRKKRMERAVAGVVHYLFKPGSSARRAGKLDADTRRLVKAMKALEGGLGEERTQSLLRQTLDMALATGDQDQVKRAWERLMPQADGSRPALVIPAAQGRMRRMLRNLFSRWTGAVPEDQITESAVRIRETAAASLQQITVHIPVRDIVERIITKRKEKVYGEVEAGFRELIEAYSTSCKDVDITGWLTPAVRLVTNRQDVRFLLEKMAEHSLSNGGEMLQFFKPDDPSVNIDKRDYDAYDAFAEALFAACRESMLDDPAPGAGDSDAFGNRTDSASTSDSERFSTPSSSAWGSSVSASTSRSSSPGRGTSAGKPALGRAATVYQAAKTFKRMFGSGRGTT